MIDIPSTQDIWTTSVFSFAPGGGGPGGGLANDVLQVGGFGDLYYSLLKFDLSGLPTAADHVVLRLYDLGDNGGSPTALNLYEITQDWNWLSHGTGADHNRLWWADQPNAILDSADQNTLVAPTVGGYYYIDITNLYNEWQSGALPNYGLELRPTANSNNFDTFASSRNANIDYQPALIITTAAVPQSETIRSAGSGLVFVNSYDLATVTPSYRSAIISAENFFQSHFTNNVTLKISFSQTSISSNFLANNTFTDYYRAITYSDLKTALLLNATTTDDLAAIRNLPSVDPTGGFGFTITSALAKTLGLLAANNSLDDTVNLNVTKSFFYDGVAQPTAYDAIGVIEHELSEGMGRIGGLGPNILGFWGPIDLFRYSGPGQPDYNGGTDNKAAYFSIDGINLLTQFNNPASVDPQNPSAGGDVADWNVGVGVATQVAVPVPGGIDAFGPGDPDKVGVVTPTDLRVMDILGWTPTYSSAANHPILWIDNANGQIEKVNSADGAVTVVGNSGLFLTDIAFNPQGQLFGITFTSLYSINTGTAAATLIGALGDGGALMNGLVCDSSGTLYAISGVTNKLYTINTLTGHATALGGTLPTSSSGDLAFEGNSLYMADSNGNLDKLSIFNGTVNASVVGPIGFSDVFGLAPGPNGILYGVSGTQLIFINSATGAGTGALDYGGQDFYAANGMTSIDTMPSATFPFSNDFLAQVEALYVGYYTRAGDPAGVNFWVGNLANGGNTLQTTAAWFSLASESQVQYPFLAHPLTATQSQISSFVASVYQDLFNRAPDTPGLNFWTSTLVHNLGNAQAVGAFILNVIYGSQGSDQTILANKVAVAEWLTHAFAAAGSFDNTLAHTLIASVTADPATVVAAEQHQISSPAVAVVGQPTTDLLSVHV